MVGRIPCWLMAGCVALFGVACNGDRMESTSSESPSETGAPAATQGPATVAEQAREGPPAPSSSAVSPIQTVSHEEAAPKQGERAPIYDVEADAGAQIEAALARAKKDNKRVLLQFGGNWCGWCYKLHDVFQNNREIATLLRNDYESVMVDIGRLDKNMNIADRYGAALGAHGVPFLTVLDADGRVLTNQDTGELENGPAHDVEQVKAFLHKWAPEARDAESTLDDALKRAAVEDKRVLVHLGAPW